MISVPFTQEQSWCERSWNVTFSKEAKWLYELYKQAGVKLHTAASYSKSVCGFLSPGEAYTNNDEYSAVCETSQTVVVTANSIWRYQVLVQATTIWWLYLRKSAFTQKNLNKHRFAPCTSALKNKSLGVWSEHNRFPVPYAVAYGWEEHGQSTLS